MIYPGYILAAIRSALKESTNRTISQEITIDNQQVNGTFGVHQARVRLKGDPTVYRLIIAPANAPLQCGGRDLETYFAQPLGEM